jgi:hypothetical protein
MLSVLNKPFTLNVFMLNDVMLSVVVPQGHRFWLTRQGISYGRKKFRDQAPGANPFRCSTLG